jgi:hypothetical protein
MHPGSLAPLPPLPFSASGHAYCFPGTVDPVGENPVCVKKGFQYYPKLKQCARSVGRECDPDHDGVPAPDNTALCIKCGLGYYINSKGLCEPQCKMGYLQVVVNGIKYCVEQCPGDATPQGNVCVDFGHDGKESDDGANGASYGGASDAYGSKSTGSKKDPKPPKCPKTCTQKSCAHGWYLFW